MDSKDSVPLTEKRRFKRIPAPVGTTALLRNSGTGRDKIYVQDISMIGMLVCDHNSEELYSINSSINNILVDIPPCKISDNKRILLLIDNGKIVRSFFDQASKAFCYGIELTYESSYVKGKIENIVKNHLTG